MAKANRKKRLTKKEKKLHVVLTWDKLNELNKDAGKVLQSLFELGLQLQKDNPDALQDREAAEVYKGYFSMLEEHIQQVIKLSEFHSVKDKNGSIILKEDGSIQFKTGECDAERDMVIVNELIIQYLNEMEGINNIINTVLPELAIQFNTQEHYQKMIEELQAETAMFGAPTANSTEKGVNDGKQ